MPIVTAMHLCLKRRLSQPHYFAREEAGFFSSITISLEALVQSAVPAGAYRIDLV
jgi:hypothetical protein